MHMGSILRESNWLFVTDWRIPSAVYICASTTAVSNMCLWWETLKQHSPCDESKSSWERRHYEVWQHVFLQYKNIIIMHSHGYFYSTQLTRDLFSQWYCCAVMQICVDCVGIWSGCLALGCLYNLIPYGQFRDHRDVFFLWSLKFGSWEWL